MFWTRYREAKTDAEKDRSINNLRSFSLHPIPEKYGKSYYIHKELTIKVRTLSGTVKFFVHRNKWLSKGVVYTGNYNEFLAWLKRRLDNG